MSSRSNDGVNCTRFFGREYIAALKSYYPHLVDSYFSFMEAWINHADELGVDGSNRFVSIADRPWTSLRDAWAFEGKGARRRHVGANCSYKGLLQLKPATDLVLYSNLIWELQPHTIIEFGSLHGGTSLWFADHLDILSGGGDVHSFDKCPKCISDRASHPRLHFYDADLSNMDTLKGICFADWQHPWLVVEDADTNLEQLGSLLSQYLLPGDYCVIEDIFRDMQAKHIVDAIKVCDKLDLLVDTKYTDAFGLNVTCAQNGWLVKMR